MRRASAPVGLTGCALLVSSAAQACSVCGQAAPENQWAYLLMTGILSVLPLALMAGVATWIALRIRAAAREEAASTPSPSPAPVPARETPKALEPSLDPSRP